ncbi:YojF family protein [Cohnella fermenti]|uniref:DUF1806 family protein n=1 Tax=Cohnella fermenti TaxID=2565925 RepID=A0A4S4BGQ9_9BACL|nr:YojF family protein [Cohnella fermenti]THF73650.1 DUF1806 family protein [Cohnella fermenti]
MHPIDTADVQRRIDALVGQDLYVHMEMTTGAYTAHHDTTKHPAANFITNAVVRYELGSISGAGPYRVGLKLEKGWIYTEGLTHYDAAEEERLLMSGHDSSGKLVVSLQFSREPF